MFSKAVPPYTFIQVDTERIQNPRAKWAGFTENEGALVDWIVARETCCVTRNAHSEMRQVTKNKAPEIIMAETLKSI